MMDWEEIINGVKLGSIFGSVMFVGILALGFGWV